MTTKTTTNFSSSGVKQGQKQQMFSKNILDHFEGNQRMSNKFLNG